MDPQWFGDTRKVRTAVVGGPDTDNPVYLPEDPDGCDRTKNALGRDSFYCGRLLGGCGGQLTARTFYDRVCHFSHRHSGDGHRCRRPSIGASGADHLFIGKALTQWLDGQDIAHQRAEYEFDRSGRAEAVTISLDDARLLHVQLRGSQPEQWKRRRATIMDEHPGSTILCDPQGSLSRLELRASGRAVLIWCITQDDSRQVVVDLQRKDRPSDPRPLADFQLDPELGMVPRAAATGPSPLRFAARIAKVASGPDESCTRFRADGTRCDRLTDAPDGWCRDPDCGGFRTAEPVAFARTRYLAPPSESDQESRLTLTEEERRRLEVSSSAVVAFRSKHHGSPQEAATELHAMYGPMLDEGTHYRLPDGTWVLEALGFRLILNEKGDNITGYDTMHAERSYAQLQAGVPSRLGRQARAQRRSLRTPMSGGDFPDRLDRDAVLQLDATQFALTAGACQAFEKLNPGTESQSDQKFIEGLYTALDTDLRTGEVYSDGERLILHGSDAWWVLATEEPAITAVHSPGTRALEVRPEAEAVEDIAEEPSSAEPKRLTQAEFEAIVSDRILSEREDDLHEEIRYRLMADLKKRARFSGGTAKDDTYVDAWYRAADGESVVFEVLEAGGYGYEHFRKSAVDLMEVAYLHTAGEGARMVLVSPEPPSEEWIPNTLLNVFGILAAWVDGTGWAGPGRDFIVTD